MLSMSLAVWFGDPPFCMAALLSASILARHWQDGGSLSACCILPDRQNWCLHMLQFQSGSKAYSCRIVSCTAAPELVMSRQCCHGSSLPYLWTKHETCPSSGSSSSGPGH